MIMNQIRDRDAIRDHRVGDRAAVGVRAVANVVGLDRASNHDRNGTDRDAGGITKLLQRHLQLAATGADQRADFRRSVHLLLQSRTGHESASHNNFFDITKKFCMVASEIFRRMIIGDTEQGVSGA